MPRPWCWRVVWGGVELWVLNYESEKQQGKGLDLDTAELSFFLGCLQSGHQLC